MLSSFFVRRSTFEKVETRRIRKSKLNSRFLNCRRLNSGRKDDIYATLQFLDFEGKRWLR